MESVKSKTRFISLRSFAKNSSFIGNRCENKIYKILAISKQSKEKIKLKIGRNGYIEIRTRSSEVRRYLYRFGKEKRRAQ